jgi:Flp pilus assembly pilin Flp
MNRVHQLWSRYNRKQSGQTMAEYALIIALVVVVGLAAWALLGTNISSTINSVAGCI